MSESKKPSRLATIEPVFTDHIPDSPEYGKLYVCEKWHVAIHLCPCGCGNWVQTPLTKEWWTMYKQDGKVTLRPSIGNFSLPCKSHYYITENHIDWL